MRERADILKIITFDLDKALNTTLTYEKVKIALFMLLRRAARGGLAQLVEDKALTGQLSTRFLRLFLSFYLIFPTKKKGKN